MDDEERLDYAHPPTRVEPVEPLIPRRLDSPGLNVGIIAMFVGLMVLLLVLSKLGCLSGHG